MTRSPIPFNRPSMAGRELEYIHSAVEGGHTAASGPFGEKAQTLLRDSIGAAEVLLTTSCTDALEMTSLLMNLGPGDVVIVPSFTFVSTALAYARTGAELLFSDIEENSLGIDPDHVGELMDSRVRAVVPVHYAGVGCDIEGLKKVVAISDRADIVEDNAHGLFGHYQGSPLGSFGRFATLSFHETKNFICGEGGALILNDEADIERAHVLYDKGTNRRAFMLGAVDKYSWTDVGSSFGLSEVLAAYLFAQLERRDEILAKRQAIFQRYDALIRGPAHRQGIRTMTVPDDRSQAYHMYYALLPDRTARDFVLRRMVQQGVQATFHYVPLHSSKAGQRFAASPTACPIAEDVSGRLLRLPFYNSLSPSDIDRVSETFLTAATEL